MSIQGVFYDRIFFLKYARVQANDAQVQGVDVVNCIVLSNGMCHTRAYAACIQSYCRLHYDRIPGVDAVNCTVLSNGMCHTRA